MSSGGKLLLVVALGAIGYGVYQASQSGLGGSGSGGGGDGGTAGGGFKSQAYDRNDPNQHKRYETQGPVDAGLGDPRQRLQDLAPDMRDGPRLGEPASLTEARGKFWTLYAQLEQESQHPTLDTAAFRRLVTDTQTAKQRYDQMRNGAGNP